MARKRVSRSPWQQLQRPRCPSCGKPFANVLRHLNHRQSKCVDWFNSTTPHLHHDLPSHHRSHSQLEPAQSLIEDDYLDVQLSPSPSHSEQDVRSTKFPGAAKIFGRAKTFMERFDDDQYSGIRASNIYYPFAGKDEWELGSFLHSSGLSMKKIDDFLQLNW